MTRPTTTYLIAYDVARPAAEKHALATRIMSLGEAWARPLEQIWYERAERRAAQRIGADLASLVGEDDGLIVQETSEEAVMANTTLRWFRRRATSSTEVSPNVVAFPIIAAPTAWTQGRGPGEPAPEVSDAAGLVRLAEAS